MRLERLTIIATALTVAAAAGAQPPQPGARETPRAPGAQPQLVLASAPQAPEAAPPPAPEAQPTTAPAKRPRAARVTSCRCGDTSQ